MKIKITILLCLFILTYLVSAFSGKGEGSLESPYIIKTCLQLQEMEKNLSANYVLGNNIDCSDTRNWNEGKGFKPIGKCEPNNRCDKLNNKYVFSGNFDGKRHTIKNLYINRPDENLVGLFGFAISNISNVGLSNINISGKNSVGGLTGAFSSFFLDSQERLAISTFREIKNIYSTGVVKGNRSVGGIVGHNLGAISNSYSTSNISGDEGIGSIAGSSQGNKISNTYSTGVVKGNRSVGGIVGHSVMTIISNSYSTSNIYAKSHVGGIVGHNLGAISNSYVTGNIYGSENIGGIAGYIDKYYSITNSYWYPSQGLTCAPDSSFLLLEKSCISIQDKEYFYNSKNEPMIRWDFEEVWEERKNDYPILKWQSLEQQENQFNFILVGIIILIILLIMIIIFHLIKRNNKKV